MLSVSVVLMAVLLFTADSCALALYVVELMAVLFEIVDWFMMLDVMLDASALEFQIVLVFVFDPVMVLFIMVQLSEMVLLSVAAYMVQLCTELVSMALTLMIE